MRFDRASLCRIRVNIVKEKIDSGKSEAFNETEFTKVIVTDLF